MAGCLGRNAEKRRLDLAEAVDVTANARDGVVEEERLGEFDDRVAEDRRLDRGVVGASIDLLGDLLGDQLDDPGLHDPGSGGDQPQGGVALLLDEGAQRGGIREGTVEAVEGFEQPGPALTLEPGPGLGQHRLGGADDDLADQLVAGAEPAVHRRPADADLRRDRLDIDPAAAQVAVEPRLDHVLAARRRRPAPLSGRSPLRHTQSYPDQRAHCGTGNSRQALRARSKSATRSSAASIPHESRTRSGETAAAESSTDWWVIACGTSIRDSTPPRDSARVNSSVRATIVAASGWRKATMPPKPGQRTSSTPAAVRRKSLTARPFSVWRATRSARVRSPRWTRKQSSGPGTAPTEFWTKRIRSCSSASRAIAAPPTTSEWPPRYLVVEWTTAVAPSSSGRWTIGVAKVLSTTTVAPPAASTTAEMSITLSSGLVGVSTHTMRVSGRIAARTASTSRSSTRSYSSPNRVRILSTSR